MPSNTVYDLGIFDAIQLCGNDYYFRQIKSKKMIAMKHLKCFSYDYNKTFTKESNFGFSVDYGVQVDLACKSTSRFLA